jgi:hypothetical protein
MGCHIYISESSRRVTDTPDSVMEERWAAGLGERRPLVCNTCGRKPSNGRLINSECDECRKGKV